MKRILVFLLVLCTVVSLTACDNGSASQIADPTDKVTQTNSPDSKKTLGLNDTATLKNLKITATEVKKTEGKTFFKPEDGKVFVGVKFEIENISDESQTVSSLLLFSAYADDVKIDYSISAAVAFSPTLDGEISAGKKLVGWYAVEVEKDFGKIEIEIDDDWLSDKKAVFTFASDSIGG